ncbi:MAG TPA: phosphatidylglycerophosphatase A [Kiritimatiellia bacterium]|nr:phosphatidylglycerophosphatase A [Kiritimatiellia bacterium]HRZ11103.1 phosphatidylglycerophosphatase A [Kiritimatiellia bacterium]HSA19525.1 phosphatidylglycerophosphatase A [Kiritimatiellia bacterium]
MKDLARRVCVALATGLGLGYSPFAPGTVGSVWGVLIVLLLFPSLPVARQVLLCLGLALVAIPICDVAERHFKKKDPHCIVADEYLTFPISLIGLPVSWSAWWILPVAFFSNRFFDIVKLPPANQLQRLRGGLGIVIDDVFAALYSLAANHAAYYLLRRWLG